MQQSSNAVENAVEILLHSTAFYHIYQNLTTRGHGLRHLRHDMGFFKKGNGCIRISNVDMHCLLRITLILRF
jgi:hypothetical protein